MICLRKTLVIVHYAVFLLLLIACGKDADNEPVYLFKSVPASETGIDFGNFLTDTEDFNIVEYLYYYNGGGVAAGDINNDGLVDLCFTANQLPARLYLNEGNFRFRDISQSSGIQTEGNWKTGVTMADVNGDGLLDVFICGVGNYKKFNGSNHMFINNGDLTFSDQTEQYGLKFSGFSSQAVFFDMDNDGDLDLYLLNHSVHTSRSYGQVILRNQSDVFSGDKLYRNDPMPDGGTHFTEVTSRSGIYNSQIAYGLGVAVSDINNDGFADIYVCNDFHENDYLYLNKGDGTFTQELERVMPHSTRFSMGVDIADINNDGWNEIVSLDMQPREEEVIKSTAGEDPYDIFEFKLRFGYHYQFTRNALQWNRGVDQTGSLLFSDIASLANVEATDWSWSALLADFDNDGFKDMFVTNGIVRRPNDLDYINYISSDSAQLYFDDNQFVRKMPEGQVPDYFFRNKGSLSFEETSKSWFDGDADLSNGAAYADLDNDGDLDLVVNHINSKASLYRNSLQEKNNFVQIELRGGRKNTSGIGAVVNVYTKDKVIRQEQMLSRGWLSSVSPIMTIGTGAEGLDSITIVWPGGQFQTRKDVVGGRRYTLDEADAGGKWKYRQPEPSKPLFEGEVVDAFVHRENIFVPFNVERLLPHVVSTQGPTIATADVNGDRLDDFFVGGAAGQAGAVLVQGKNGTFRLAGGAFPENTSDDTGSCFFDADGDGDADLAVVSGGQESRKSAADLKPRLFINDGKGGFRLKVNSFPEMHLQASCVENSDFDNDGDIDLFIGGRVVAGKYGVAAKSFLMVNDGRGIFTEAGGKLPEAFPGLVTDASWADINGDKKQDLVVVGEWTNIGIFIQDTDGSFRDQTAKYGLSGTSGLWSCLEGADFDNDGDIDFAAGNLGLNSRLRASKDQPVEMYVGDLDGNGGYEQILTYYNGGKRYPFISRDQLVKQVPPLKRKFLKYADFRNIALEDIIHPDSIPGFIHLKAETLSSVYLENRGNVFVIHELPFEAQVSPVFSFCAADVNEDGFPDLVGGGNLYKVQPEFGRYDASYGMVLAGDGKGGFRSLPHEETGFVVKGEVRKVAQVKIKGQPALLVGRNNDSVMIFKSQ